MNDFEYLLCALLIPVVYVLTYIAGKYDLLGIICQMLEEKTKELKRKEFKRDDGKGCETCRWNDTDPNEVGCPCWNCKGDYSEYAKAMSPEAFSLMMDVLEDMGELED